MQAFVFPSEQALRVALTAGLVPAKALGGPVEFCRLTDGQLVIAPGKELSRAEVRALEQAGVRLEARLPLPAWRAGSWAEVVASRRVAETAERPRSVLFVLAEGGDTLLSLCAELLRLGCDRQEFQVLKSEAGAVVALVRAHEAPYYTVAKAMDHTGGLRAFVPCLGGREGVWTELGYAHPLAERIEVKEGELVLVAGEGGWLRLPSGPWTDVDQLVTFTVGPTAHPWKPAPMPERFEVPLRLERAARGEAAALWVLEDSATSRVEALVRGIPEGQLQRLLFAVASRASGPPMVVLRVRPGRGEVPMVVAGTGYVPVRPLGNLFAPEQLAIEPPLRADRLRELLAPDPDQLYWLRPEGGPLARGPFRIEALPDSAFRPLVDWVDYVVDSAAEALVPWIQGATFELPSFEAERDEAVVPGGAAQPEGTGPAGRARPRRATKGTDRDGAGRSKVVAPSPSEGALRKALAVVAEPARELTAGEQALAGAESAFLASELAADAPERMAAWIELATLNAAAGRKSDAGLCWTRVVWEAGQGERQLAERWATSEGGAGAPEASRWEHHLACSRPTVDQTRAFAALVFAHPVGSKVRPGELERAQRWFELHDDSLDVRSLWLSRLGLSRLAGGDRLSLARTRDRLLARLYRGLGLERDVPRFLRQVGAEPTSGARVAEQLEELFGKFAKAARKRSAVEAPVALTQAYVTFEFAYGFARLGSAQRARELLVQARTTLGQSADPVHGWLARAYVQRIEHALEGHAPATPLPPSLTEELNQFAQLERYKIDRLRQASKVLEPQERLDPIAGFMRNEKDPRGAELAALRGVQEPAELRAALDRLVPVACASTTPTDERTRLLDGLLDFLPLLPEALALPALQELLRGTAGLAPAQRALVLEDALQVAGHFQRGPLVRELSTALEALLCEGSPEQAQEVAFVLGTCLRSLRRVGLKEEAAELLEAAAQANGGQGPKALVARLTLAAGFWYLGRREKAAPEMEQAFEHLAEEKGTVGERLAVTRAAAAALSNAPAESALPGLRRLAEQLPWMTDSFNTNSHFCLSVVDFADALVLGHVKEDLALAESVRRFLEEDEYLVRRRVHREMEEHR